MLFSSWHIGDDGDRTVRSRLHAPWSPTRDRTAAWAHCQNRSPKSQKEVANLGLCYCQGPALRPLVAGLIPSGPQGDLVCLSPPLRRLWKTRNKAAPCVFSAAFAGQGRNPYIEIIPHFSPGRKSETWRPAIPNLEQRPGRFAVAWRHPFFVPSFGGSRSRK